MWIFDEGAMQYRGANTVEPGATIRMPGRRERRAGELLGIEPVRSTLRRILADGQRTIERFRCVLAAESRQILQRAVAHCLHAAVLQAAAPSICAFAIATGATCRGSTPFLTA